jgi:invasion protein IalB
MLGRIFVNALVATSLLGAFALNAQAQNAAPTPAPDASAPALNPAVQQPAVNPNLAVNELHDNWSVRCFTVESQAPCDVLQVGTNAESQQRVSLISIAYLPASQSFAAQIIVPLGVALARGLSLEAGEGSLRGVKFNRCEVDGCYVEIALPQSTVDSIRLLAEDTLITVYSYGSGETLELPFSVSGFSEAIDHMMSEAETRAVERAPQ